MIRQVSGHQLVRINLSDQTDMMDLLGTDLPVDSSQVEREFVIDNLLVRIHFIVVMIRWTGLAPSTPHRH